MILKYSLKDIDKIARKLLEESKTKTILFKGEMGSGKTTLISAMVKILGGKSKASSPTFSIVNEYKVKSDIVYHFDFYRIKNQIEALDIGIEDYFYSGNWNFVEWPDKIKPLLPNNTTTVKLSILSNQERELEWI
jgi:tRNA threonylcarbamoyladenosine biosynthesis protein TsaE|tara:strand:+ start:121 stop:525 length:405 start_codon:yes stop_codon:yes gene_type:complete